MIRRRGKKGALTHLKGVLTQMPRNNGQGLLKAKMTLLVM